MKDIIEQKQQGPELAILDGVELPLKNIEFTIEQYLLAHGTRLDTETRILLAGIRDCVGRVAGSSRALAGKPRAELA